MREQTLDVLVDFIIDSVGGRGIEGVGMVVKGGAEACSIGNYTLGRKLTNVLEFSTLDPLPLFPAKVSDKLDSDGSPRILAVMKKVGMMTRPN